jgi:hypothetical protein
MNQPPFVALLQMRLGTQVSVWLQGMSTPFSGKVAAITTDYYVVLKNENIEFKLAGSQVVAVSHVRL